MGRLSPPPTRGQGTGGCMLAGVLEGWRSTPGWRAACVRSGMPQLRATSGRPAAPGGAALTLARAVPPLAALAALCALSSPVCRASEPPIPTMVIHPDIPPDARRFMARAQTTLAAGDLSATRLLLLPAAQAGSAIAARQLAETYDPVWLYQHNVIGIDGLADLMAAARWYKRAADLGDDKPGNRYIDGEKH